MVDTFTGCCRERKGSNLPPWALLLKMKTKSGEKLAIYLLSLPAPVLGYLKSDPWRIIEYREAIKSN